MGPVFLQIAIVSSSIDFSELGCPIHIGKDKVSNNSVVCVKQRDVRPY
jgi:hypothetical protein